MEDTTPRPAPISTAPFPNNNITVSSIPIVCRFVPHDQWFLTHLAPYWKGKHIKHHILSKCLNLAYKPPDAPKALVGNETQGKDHRTPSPITFAPDPRIRPPSPILFATVRAKSILSSDEEDESLTIDEWEDDMSLAKSPSDVEGLSDAPSASEKGKARQVDSLCEEGDDSPDESPLPQGGRVLPSRRSLPAPHSIPPSQTVSLDRGTLKPYPSPHAPTPDRISKHSKLLQKLTSSSTSKTRIPPRAKEDPKLVPQLAHLSFSLIRFSTGQILEDEYLLSDQNISPHEILELHFSFSSLQKDSRIGTLPPTAKFPFPLLVPPPQQSQTKSRRKKARLRELIAAHSIRLIQLPRSVPQMYILPYWEGWVRILRYVCRDDQTYIYGSPFPLPGTGGSGSKNKDKAAQGNATRRSNIWGDPVDTEAREKDLDMNLAVSFGLVSKPKDNSHSRVGGETLGKDALKTVRHSDQHSRSRFEWRERWLVIREGWIFLLRDRSDTKPTHRFPLSHLYMLRDADRLTESIDNAKGGGRRSRDHGPPKDSDGPTSPLREQGRTPVPSTLDTNRSPSPDSTLKGVPIRSSLHSGYGHGMHHLGKQVAKILHEDEEYDEDDEGDRKKPETRSPKKRVDSVHRRQQHHHHQHHHHHSSSQSIKTEVPRNRPRDLSDPAVRARINRNTFIPNSKDEADLFGMRIICAKFLHPTAAEKADIPKPFGELKPDRDKPSIGSKYTNGGPSLADVAVANEGGEVEKGKAKERSQAPKTPTDRLAKSKPKAPLHSKGSAPSSLSADFGPNQTANNTFSMIADRRPSLPLLPQAAAAWMGSQAHVSSSPALNATSSVASAAMSFSSIFGSTKDKEEKKKEKEAKREAKKRAEKEKMDNGEGVTSGSSWKLGLGKKSKDKGGTTTPLSTAGTIEEDLVVHSKLKELPATPQWNQTENDDANASTRAASRRSSSSSNMGDDPFPKFARPPGFSSDEDLDRPGFRSYNLAPSSRANSTHMTPAISPLTVQKPEVRASDSDSASTSPVFARENASGEDGEDSALDIDLGLKQRRTGYRYGGYQKAGSTSLGSEAYGQEPYSPGGTSRKGTVSEGVASPVDKRKGKQASVKVETKSKTEKRKVPKRGEWMIMDFGNDAAYHSLLRILHRNTNETITSSFVPGLQSLGSSSKPTSRHDLRSTPPPSPPVRDDIFGTPVPVSPSLLDSSSLHSPGSPLRGRSRSDAAFMPQTRLPRSGPYSDDENDGRSSRTSPRSYTRPRPSLLSGYEGRSVVNTLPRGLGAFPYPEWRLQAVNRAMRAGLGHVNRPLEIMMLAMNEKYAEHFNPTDSVFEMPGPPFPDSHRPETDEDDEDDDENDEDKTLEGEGPPEDDKLDDGDDEREEDEDPDLLFSSESEEEDHSEYEWQAWSADLPRQLRLRNEQRNLDTASVPPQSPAASYEALGGDADDSDGNPTTLEGETLEMLKRRRKQEPCGVITSMYTSTALPGFVARDTVDHHDNEEHRQYHIVQRYPASVGTLSSPSSSESLAPRHLAHSPENAGRSVSSSLTNSPQSAQAHSRHSHSLSHTLPHKSSRSSNRHSLLHHSSIQSNLRIPSESLLSSHESMRKPSTPALGPNPTGNTTVTEQTFSLSPNSFGMAIQELNGQDNPSGGGDPPSSSLFPMSPLSSSYESHRFNLDLPPNFEILRPGSPISQHRVPSNISLASRSSLRHQSSNFSMAPSMSTASSLSKPNALKKQPPAPPPNERDDGEFRGRAVEEKEGGCSPRPKLTVATSAVVDSSLQSPARGYNSATTATATTLASGSSSSSTRNTSRSLVRHNKSGSSLRSALGLGGEGEGASGVEPKAKKKKSGAFGKFVKSFDSAFP